MGFSGMSLEPRHLSPPFLILHPTSIYPGGIILLGWISSSIPRPPGKRAAAIALVNGFANIGQVRRHCRRLSLVLPSFPSFAVNCVELTVHFLLRFGWHVLVHWRGHI